MFTNYQQVKNDVLNIYTEFLQITKKAKFPSEDNSMVALEHQAKNIEQDKFLLMVAGEAKSGKSTFINAYLGRDILPMDVKQCTSAIIEIRHGDSYSLKATYADGRTEIIGDSEAIPKFLIKHASLDDDFREIPISTINNEVLIKYKDNIPKNVIDDLVRGVQDENIYGLPPNDFSRKIRKYIDKMRKEWASIVTKIEISYPFGDDALKGIEIVDSPGVNAQGRMGEITNDYIKNANAIMFLKPLTGTALESTSFRRFLESASVDRNEGALFLVLTRAATMLPEELETLRAESLRLYSNSAHHGSKSIANDHIICVDSKVELFIKDINSMSVDDIDVFIAENEDKIDPFMLPPRSMKTINKDRYIEILGKKSNFFEIYKVLNSFGRKAHYIALAEFLDRMRKIYSKIEDDLKQKIELNKLKAKSPTELASRIAEINQTIDDINSKIYKTVSEISRKYTGSGGIITGKVDEGIKRFEAEIKAISNSNIDELEKISFRKIKESTSFQDIISKNILAECNAALVTLSHDKGISYTSLEPDFTPEMFKSIKDKTYEQSKESVPYQDGITFKETKYRSQYSVGKHFEKVKSSILSRIEAINSQVACNLIEFTRYALDTYKSELEKNAKAKSDELNNLMEEKKTSEEIVLLIAYMEELLKNVSESKDEIEERRGGLTSNE